MVGRLPEEEIDRAVAHYAQYFDEVGEGQALAALGTPQEVVAAIFGETAHAQQPPYTGGYHNYRTAARTPRRHRWALPAILAAVLIPLILAGSIVFSFSRAVIGSSYSVSVPMPSMEIIQAPSAAALPDFPDFGIPVDEGMLIDSLPLGALTDVDIDLRAAEIEVRVGNEARLELYAGQDGSGYDFSYEYNDAGVLRVWDDGGWDTGMSGHLSSARVVVTVLPGKQIPLMRLHSQMGSIYAEVNAGELDVQTEFGSVYLCEATADRLNVSVEGGTITLEGGIFGAADLTNDMGEITAFGVLMRGLRASSRMGNIDLSGALYGDTDITQELGSVSVRTSLPRDVYGYDLQTDLGVVSVAGEGEGLAMQAQGEPNFIRVKSDLGAVNVAFDSE